MQDTTVSCFRALQFFRELGLASIVSLKSVYKQFSSFRAGVGRVAHRDRCRVYHYRLADRRVEELLVSTKSWISTTHGEPCRIAVTKKLYWRHGHRLQLSSELMRSLVVKTLSFERYDMARNTSIFFGIDDQAITQTQLQARFFGFLRHESR